MVILEILGYSEAEFFEFIAFISVYVMLGLFIFFGFKFIHDSRGFEKGTAQRAYFAGLGLFIISICLGQGIYLTDLAYRAYMDQRIFLTLSQKGFNWRSIVGYELESLMDRDYYIVTFTALIISLSFLMKPLEKFMLRRETPIITYINRIFIPIPVIIRVLEVNFYAWFGIKVVSGSIIYYILSGLWIAVIGVMVISVAILIGLYFKMGVSAPKGSAIKRKSFLIIIGYLLWLITIFLTATIFREIEGGDWYFFPVIPILLLLSLKCISSGFKREF